ncbi:hypothetical protein EDD18DRAFT_1105565 [Armillaria luteobubalina]|uniref:Uncharacterized protein n=1 Tax=Armillaria luteobubalina TaxID=153913 RepID=A0AA39Q792_9AGAR|nr:hypothetical protein EDD18DRAFT_1105565 [Armillaria luteobubalina]
MEPTQNIGFMATTGFRYDKEKYLAQNAIHYYILESGKFTALSDVWPEMIWQQHILYWPPNDHSNDRLIAHHKHVQHTLQWLYDTLDPDAHEKQLTYALAHELKVYPSGPLESQHTTFQVPVTHLVLAQIPAALLMVLA